MNGNCGGLAAFRIWPRVILKVGVQFFTLRKTDSFSDLTKAHCMQRLGRLKLKENILMGHKV